MSFGQVIFADKSLYITLRYPEVLKDKFDLVDSKIIGSECGSCQIVSLIK